MSPRPAAFHDPLSVPRAGAAVPRPESPYEADEARRQHFSAYFDERYHKDRRRQAERREDKKKDDGPRKHHWTFTEILWTYRYTMIAAIHTSQNQFGEAPVFLPLLRRAMTMLDVKEIGGDKAYDANYIYQFAMVPECDARFNEGPASTRRASPPRPTGATTPRRATTHSRRSSATRSTARARKPSAAKSCACASPTI